MKLDEYRTLNRAEKAEALNAQLVEALILAEWGSFEGEWYYCPICGGRQDRGHAQTCEIKAALEAVKGETP